MKIVTENGASPTDPSAELAESSPSDEIRLTCLNGAVAPAQIRKDWAGFQNLPTNARANIWEILRATLGVNREEANIDARGQAFCQLYDASPRDVQAAVRVCEFLLSQAARADVDVELLRKDLAALGASDTTGADTLLAHYPEAKAMLREQILKESLLAHGNVLAGVEWRVDRMMASDKGVNLGLPIVLLSLSYRSGKDSEKLTLSLTREDLKGLAALCQRIDLGFETSDSRENEGPVSQ